MDFGAPITRRGMASAGPSKTAKVCVRLPKVPLPLSQACGSGGLTVQATQRPVHDS